MLSTSVPAHAQSVGRETPRKGSLELSGGALWTGGTDQGNATATLTRNPSTGSGAFELFRSDATVGSVVGLQARFGVYLSSSLSLEAGAQLARPELRVRLTGDSEGAPDVTATESITSYVFTGSVVYHVRRSGRFRPFLLAGAGHVRDLHEGSDLVETGPEYHAGGGVKFWLGNGRRKFGLRSDVGISARDGGVGADEERRIVPTAAISLAYLF
ncbi:MAG TPA: outer membrane beta-barrel protein [Vicinamibacterales bacterium]|nr:outer membrane beta-barrel protein [Vicinamibacterales bacterium]